MPLNNTCFEKCDCLLNKISTELLLTKPNSDEGLIPIYSLLGELIQATQSEPTLNKACELLEDQLSNLLDNAKYLDDSTINYINSFIEWWSDAIVNTQKNEPQKEFLNFSEFSKSNSPSSSTTTTSPSQPSSSPQTNTINDAIKKLSDETDKLLVISSDTDQELLSEFHNEANEHLEQIESTLLVLEKNPEDEESLNSIFRSFHTIKGVSGFLHLIPIQSLAHDVESLLDHARNKKLILSTQMITVILKSRDCIRALVDQVGHSIKTGQTPTNIIPVSHLIIQVKALAAQALGLPLPDVCQGIQLTELQKNPSPTNSTPSPKEQKTTPTDTSTGQGEKQTIRVQTTKLDNLMDMVGELVIIQSQLAESAKSYDNSENNTSINQNLGQLNRITKELQHTSMSLRMIPVKPSFQKVTRIARDLANQFNKKINIEVFGEDTELDRNVVEQIGDPLVHMIRNALDHGLEPTQERIEKGKPEIGTVQLKAYYMGSNIIIEMCDDGRGLNAQKLIEKAKSKGIISQDEKLTEEQAWNLIFAPGFSTAEKVTDVSGRGVGMDVVKRNIEQLRGSVEIHSVLGQGTTFKIKLPLTTAIIDGLLIQVGQDKFIIPTTSVKVALRPSSDQISTIQGEAEILNLRGQSIPIERLSELFNIPSNIKAPSEGIILIIETMNKPYGLLVDNLLSKQEVVIKSLGNIMSGIVGIAGGAILGDGTIGLILDPSTLRNATNLNSELVASSKN